LAARPRATPIGGEHDRVPNLDLPRVLTVAGALRSGVTRAQLRTELRRGRWRWLAPRVLLTHPSAPTREDWVQVGLVLGRSGGVVSGWDAVRLRGIGPDTPPSDQVLILTTRGKNRIVGGVHLRPSTRPLTPAMV
jgi:hypothetical protein